MTRKFRNAIPAALGMTLMFGSWSAADEPKDLPPTQQPKRTGEAIGETVDNVVQSLKRGARATSETLQEQYQKARASIHDMGVQARVYSRLHWDKAVGDSKVELEVKEGVATLRGTVRSVAARAKAVDLTRDTIGIDRVEDHLTVVPDSPVTPAQPSER